jgi:hypothetical protein
MPRLFSRIISFKVDGEIYDTKTNAEDILKNYSWSFREGENGKCWIYGYHKDSRGLISNITRLPFIGKVKKPDSEFLVTM